MDPDFNGALRNLKLALADLDCLEAPAEIGAYVDLAISLLEEIQVANDVQTGMDRGAMKLK